MKKEKKKSPIRCCLCGTGIDIDKWNEPCKCNHLKAMLYNKYSTIIIFYMMCITYLGIYSSKWYLLGLFLTYPLQQRIDHIFYERYLK